MRRALAAALAAVLVSGCARKAPGPTECRRFALSAFGLPSEEAIGTRRELELRDRVDELTRECLTVPYDREVLRCTDETGRFRACLLEFELRRHGRSERMLPR